MSTESFDRIKKWAKLINKKPNYDCTHFYLSDNERTMIIDLTRMEVMPPQLKKLSEKEKSYLFIDLNNPKTVRYYAHDVSPAIVEEVVGEILFSLVENDILKYIENNICELTTEKAPMTALVDMYKDEFQRVIPSVAPPEPKRLSHEGSRYGTGHNQPTSHTNPYGQHMGGTPYQHAAWGASSNYNASAYKEREQFMDTLYSLVKRGETGPAVDHIRAFLTSKWEDKEALNIVFRMLSLDKMDFISLKELLIMTDPIKNEVSERAVMLAKFEAFVNRTKPRKALSLLKEVHPNA